MNRREFLSLAAAGGTTPVLSVLTAGAQSTTTEHTDESDTQSEAVDLTVQLY